VNLLQGAALLALQSVGWVSPVVPQYQNADSKGCLAIREVVGKAREIRPAQHGGNGVKTFRLHEGLIDELEEDSEKTFRYGSGSFLPVVAQYAVHIPLHEPVKITCGSISGRRRF